MSDYQSCVLREIVGPRECVIEATLCHADALLPLPGDRPTLLRMIAEGRDRKQMPAFRPALGTFADDTLVARASEVIESAEVVWCGANEKMAGASPSGAMARYRVRFREDLDWKGIRVGGGWGAAADLPVARQELPHVDLNFLDRFSRSPKRPEPAEAVARLGAILASRPADVGHVARLLGSHDALGAPFAPLLEEALHVWPECPDVARALGRIGDPASLGPLVLALWQGKSHRLRNENIALEDAALIALGWYGPRARAMAESYLRRDQPLTLALSFARWRVLGDEASRRQFVSGQWPEDPNPDAPGWEAQAAQALFEGPVLASVEVIAAVRPELGDTELDFIPFATREAWHQAKVDKVSGKATKRKPATAKVAPKAPEVAVKRAPRTTAKAPVKKSVKASKKAAKVPVKKKTTARKASRS